ncbi:hypothetical protein SAMN05421780_104146 [Flexibacter flexilis DSM 6793]|uniref:Uncharacterized protein n=1 Tax=Flexibacter flexilis DSM 6793 TaxID=927664 RepID=A0A1I1I7K3_9BACT|nr:hypothetical protein SAMN05421780_104146 [Flexibacter flexilis DSM 6793]
MQNRAKPHLNPAGSNAPPKSSPKGGLHQFPLPTGEVGWGLEVGRTSSISPPHWGGRVGFGGWEDFINFPSPLGRSGGVWRSGGLHQFPLPTGEVGWGLEVGRTSSISPPHWGGREGSWRLGGLHQFPLPLGEVGWGLITQGWEDFNFPSPLGRSGGVLEVGWGLGGVLWWILTRIVIAL